MSRVLFGLACLAVWSGACGDYSLDPLPLQIGLEASKVTAAPGDTINFLVSAQGGYLSGVDIDFADGSTDRFGTSGARTAHVTFKHAYLTAGTFQVQATVTDANAGVKDATIQILVN